MQISEDFGEKKVVLKIIQQLSFDLFLKLCLKFYKLNLEIFCGTIKTKQIANYLKSAWTNVL